MTDLPVIPASMRVGPSVRCKQPSDPTREFRWLYVNALECRTGVPSSEAQTYEELTDPRGPLPAKADQAGPETLTPTGAATASLRNVWRSRASS